MSDFFSEPNQAVRVQMKSATTDAVNHLHVKMVALAMKCVTSEPEDTSAHVHLVIAVIGVTKNSSHVTTYYCLGVTPMEFIK